MIYIVYNHSLITFLFKFELIAHTNFISNEDGAGE